MNVKTQRAVNRALKLIREESREYNTAFTGSDVAKSFCALRLGQEQREHFLVLYLNSQNQLIEDVILFSGTINAASVYPREVIKKALELNAASVIFSHNHPSGDVTPSEADKHITNKLKAGLNLVDINVLDHIIVGGADTCSFSERGLL